MKRPPRRAGRAPWPQDPLPVGGEGPKTDLLAGALLAIVVAFLLFLVTPPTTASGGFAGDARFYGAQAGLDLPGADQLRRTAPYCWRVLTPFLVSLTPLPTLQGFRLLALLSVVATLALLFQSGRDLGLPRLSAAVGVVLYAGIHWTVQFSFLSPAYIDPLTQCFIMAALVLIGRQRHYALLPLLAVGVLQRETLLLLVPVSYVALAVRSGWASRESLTFLGGATASAAVPLAVVHAVIVPVNPWYVREGLGWTAYLGQTEFWLRFLGETFSGLGLLPFLLALLPRGVAQVCRRSPALPAAVLLGLPVLAGGWDKGRLFLFVVPALTLACAVLLDEAGRRLRRAPWLVWVAVTLVVHWVVGGVVGSVENHGELMARVASLNAQGLAYRQVLYRSLLMIAAWMVGTKLLLRLPRARCGSPPAGT